MPWKKNSAITTITIKASVFYLEGGDGYYFFTRKEDKIDLERKLEASCKWIDYLNFLKSFDAIFGLGLLFCAADIEIRIGCDLELKEMAAKLFPDKNKLSYTRNYE